MRATGKPRKACGHVITISARPASLTVLAGDAIWSTSAMLASGIGLAADTFTAFTYVTKG